MKKIRFVFNVATLLLSTLLVPVESQARQRGTIADESMNPLCTVIAVPFENNTLFGVGPSESTANVLNVKPIFPVNLGGWNLINRMVVPLAWSEGQDELIGDSFSFGGGNPGSFGLGSAAVSTQLTPSGFPKIDQYSAL